MRRMRRDERGSSGRRIRRTAFSALREQFAGYAVAICASEESNKLLVLMKFPAPE